MKWIMREPGHRVPASGSTRRSNRLRKTLGTGALLSALLSSGGCYGYVAANPSMLEKGEQIRVVLEKSAANRIYPALQNAPEAVEGNFTNLTSDSLDLAVWIGQAYVGTPFQNTHQTISIARNEMQEIQQRQLSKWRTGLSAALVVAAFAWGTQRVFYNPGRTPPPDGGTVTPPTTPTGIQVPLFRILGAVLR